MLTVKIKQPGGDELLFEATDITRDESGLLVQREGATEYYGPGGIQYSLSARGETADPMQTAATVYVMNRHGATVATYQL